MSPRPANRQPTTVSHELGLRLLVPDGASVPVSAVLRYESQDPFAVHVGFRTAPGDIVEWTFARQLLGEGVRHPAGAGDVRVWPALCSPDRVEAGRICLSLCSPSGTALFDVPRSDIVEFLARTYDLVPAGTESDRIDLDAELAMLLWDGAEG